MEELTDYQQLVTMTTNRRQRKRVVPDDQKTEEYWKRRCKNNMAAKKSRENRRLQELRLQNQVLQLEEENLLLKRELETIKKCFNIPTGLSASSYEDYIRAVGLNPDQGVSASTDMRLRHKVQIKQEKMDTTCADNSKTISGSFYNLPQFSLINGNVQNGISPQKDHVTFDVTSGNMAKTYGDPISEIDNIRDTSSSSDEDAMPTDLTMTKKTRKFVNSIPSNEHSSSEIFGHENDSTANHIDLTADEDSDSADNDEIKTKLQVLSDQVEYMQKMFCDIDSASR